MHALVAREAHGEPVGGGIPPGPELEDVGAAADAPRPQRSNLRQLEDRIAGERVRALVPHAGSLAGRCTRVPAAAAPADHQGDKRERASYDRPDDTARALRTDPDSLKLRWRSSAGNRIDPGASRGRV